MKTYNQTNFFKHTFCEFHQVDNFVFPKNTNYKSKSDSCYFYTDEGVYRKSNHWGRVANCRWKLITEKKYKNQKTVIGFANWVDFYPINSTKKNFYIDVDFINKSAKIKAAKKETTKYIFSFADAQKKKKQIHQLFKNDKWANYFNEEIESLSIKIITEFINSEKDLLQIKKEFKALD